MLAPGRERDYAGRLEAGMDQEHHGANDGSALVGVTEAEDAQDTTDAIVSRPPSPSEG
jgi:hypothetical protein